MLKPDEVADLAYRMKMRSTKDERLVWSIGGLLYFPGDRAWYERIHSYGSDLSNSSSQERPCWGIKIHHRQSMNVP